MRTIRDEDRDIKGGHEPFTMGEAICVAESEKAIQVTLTGGNDEFDFEETLWIPKSVVHDDSEVFSYREPNNTGKLVVKQWWADKQMDADR